LPKKAGKKAVPGTSKARGFDVTASAQRDSRIAIAGAGTHSAGEKGGMTNVIAVAYGSVLGLLLLSLLYIAIVDGPGKTAEPLQTAVPTADALGPVRDEALTSHPQARVYIEPPVTHLEFKTAVAPIATPPAPSRVAPAEVEIKGRIVLVIDDLGLSSAMTRRVTSLPGPLTLSFLPYANGLRRQTREARAQGHELMVHLPMEPESGGVDPGPNALLTTMSERDTLIRLDWNLGRFPGFAGVNNHMGSLFTEDRSHMIPVLRELRRRGLFFMDSRTTPRTVGIRLAQELGMRWSARDVFLDNVREPDAIRRQLAEVERVALRSGQAIAIGHPYFETVEALRDWITSLPAKGLQLVAASEMVRRPTNSVQRTAGGGD
jgi:uncharacterized protein